MALTNITLWVTLYKTKKLEKYENPQMRKKNLEQAYQLNIIQNFT